MVTLDPNKIPGERRGLCLLNQSLFIALDIALPQA